MRQSNIYILPDSEGIEWSTTTILNAVPDDTTGIYTHCNVKKFNKCFDLVNTSCTY